jgi:integrase/recombinase XerD
MPRILSDRTQVEYRGALRSAFGVESPPFGRLDVAKVSSWGYSRRIVLLAAIRWSKGLGVKDRDFDVDRVPLPARPPYREVRIPPEQALCLYENEVEKLPDGAHAVCLLPLRLGLRVSELCGLRRSDVERSRHSQTVIVLRKGNREQEIPADHCKELVGELLKIPHWKRVGEILCDGLPSSQVHRVEVLIKAVGARVGLDLHPHLLRHGFATRLARDGASPVVIQKWLGHKSLQTTSLYLHVDLDDMRKYARGRGGS